jgi:preprotein translocase SecE subunit
MDVVRPLPKPGRFLANTRLEWRKVDWPMRAGRTAAIVLATISVITSFVFSVDYVFTRFLLRAF